MSQPLTDWLRESRLTVVEVRRDLGQIRVKGDAGGCTALACSGHVVDDGGAARGLETLNPGDIIKVEREPGRPERIVVVRRVWDELTSPEF